MSLYTLNELNALANKVFTYRNLGDDDFYFDNPELKRFDNGEGFFTLSENMDVEMGEFVAYGKSLLLRQDEYVDEEEAFETAQEKLSAILKTKDSEFVLFYMTYVLDEEVQEKFIPVYGRKILAEHFPRDISINGFKLLRRHNSDSNYLDSFPMYQLHHIYVLGMEQFYAFKADHDGKITASLPLACNMKANVNGLFDNLEPLKKSCEMLEFCYDPESDDYSAVYYNVDPDRPGVKENPVTKVYGNYGNNVVLFLEGLINYLDFSGDDPELALSLKYLQTTFRYENLF